MQKLEMDPLKYARKVEALIRSEASLRAITRRLANEAFQNGLHISEVWDKLPIQYATIPLQATIYLGALERRQKRKGRIASTEMVDLFKAFCQLKEGQMLSRATFNSVVPVTQVPLFSTLDLIHLYRLIEMSCEELRPYVDRQGGCTSQAHPS